MLAHAPREKLAQRRQAERRAVVGERDVIGAGQGAQRPPQSLLAASRTPAASRSRA